MNIRLVNKARSHFSSFYSAPLIIGLAALSMTLPCGVYAAEAAPKTYAYSMLAPGKNGSNVVFARLIIDQENATCPSLSGDNGKITQTQVRPLSIIGGQQFGANNFKVTVCEAIIAPGVIYSNAKHDVKLSAVTFKPMNVQVYGDSGCKTGVCGQTGPSIEFQALSKLGATQSADLILHMGDYNYRGTSAHFADKIIKAENGHPKKSQKIYAYDAGDTPNPEPTCSYYDEYYSQNAVNSPKPDNWQTWQVDFFEPAADLLPKAPWVFTRGNHELCSRAGVGWFYFLGLVHH